MNITSFAGQLLDDPTSPRAPLENDSLKADELNVRGHQFLERFRRTGDDEDVCRAIKAYEQAVASLSKDDGLRLGGFLNNIGLGYKARYERFGLLDDLEKAITSMQKGVAATAEGDPNFAGWLNNLGLSFSHRFERTGDMQDISEAIRYQQRAVQLTPEG